VVVVLFEVFVVIGVLYFELFIWLVILNVMVLLGRNLLKCMCIFVVVICESVWVIVVGVGMGEGMICRVIEVVWFVDVFVVVRVWLLMELLDGVGKCRFLSFMVMELVELVVVIISWLVMFVLLSLNVSVLFGVNLLIVLIWSVLYGFMVVLIIVMVVVGIVFVVMVVLIFSIVRSRLV